MAEKKRVLIVGGVAGGASAAARARRLSEDAEIIVFERGENVSFANCGMPYYIGGVIADRKRLLVQTPESLRKRFRLDVRVRTEVTRIDRAKHEVVAVDRAAGREYREKYDALVLSPGAEPVRPAMPGVESPLVWTLRSLGDMDAIHALVTERASTGSARPECVEGRRPERAVVVGGGYIGLEMAEALRTRGLGVTLVELTQQVMGPVDPEMAAPLHQELRAHGVDLRLGTSVKSFAERDGGLDVALSTGEIVRCGLAVLAVGVRPESKLAKEAGLVVGALGGIVVDEHQRTSDPDIYAVGDVIESSEFVSGGPAVIPLAGPASRQGRVAADNIFERESVYRRTQGTAICKVFGQVIGMTGLSERALRKAEIAYEKVYVHPAGHASYYPGATPISLKLLFDPESGRILGAQAVGTAGVDKRIDVLALAIQGNMTVFDLEEAELSYAPPYGSVRDVINYAGFVAANAMRGDARLCHVKDVLAPKPEQVVLDVRTDAEFAAGTIPGAMHIPVDELRERAGELPSGKEVLAFCQVGLRGYLACRILSQRGIACRNLTGGYRTYQMVEGLPKPPPAPKELKDDAGGGGGAGGNGGGNCAGVGQVGQVKRCDAGPVAASGCCAEPKLAVEVDASGLQCPGPIQQLKAAVESVGLGERVRIKATDPGFAADVPAWCRATGHNLEELVRDNGGYRATVVKCNEGAASARGGRVGEAEPSPFPLPGRERDWAATPAAPTGCRGVTEVVFSNDFDRVMAAFIIANGAASMGCKVTMFFTFWGLNVLRREERVRVRKTVVERLFGWMMPRGAKRLALSKMQMAGMGLAMMKGIMRRKRVASLSELMRDAKAAGVRLVACAMSMDLMGMKSEEMIDGVESGGVAAYLGSAESAGVNLFI